MRKFLLTSTKFTGTAELVYNDEGLLRVLDFLQTSVTTEQFFLYLKMPPPLTIEHLKNGVGITSTMTVVEAEYEISFEEFWKAYPHKRQRFLVEPVWNKLNTSERVKAFFSLPSLAAYKKKNPWYNIMLADRYLKEKHYETDWKNL